MLVLSVHPSAPVHPLQPLSGSECACQSRRHWSATPQTNGATFQPLLEGPTIHAKPPETACSRQPCLARRLSAVAARRSSARLLRTPRLGASPARLHRQKLPIRERRYPAFPE